MQSKLEYVESFNKPDVKPVGIVILLHGLGADCNDFVPIVPEIPLNTSIKFIFPNAPMRPITVNGGYVMRGWYDIREFGNLSNLTDTTGISQSVTQIEALIQEQINLGFMPNQIVLAGFSQGGAISYVTSLNTKYKLGGVLAMSCYLPSMPTSIATGLNKDTPHFAIHGTEDPVVPYTGGLHAYQELKNHGYNIQWAEYPMPHSVCHEEIAAIGKWLNTIFSQ